MVASEQLRRLRALSGTNQVGLPCAWRAMAGPTGGAGRRAGGLESWKAGRLEGWRADIKIREHAHAGTARSLLSAYLASRSFTIYLISTVGRSSVIQVLATKPIFVPLPAVDCSTASNSHPGMHLLFPTNVQVLRPPLDRFGVSSASTAAVDHLQSTFLAHLHFYFTSSTSLPTAVALGATRLTTTTTIDQPTSTSTPLSPPAQLLSPTSHRRRRPGSPITGMR